MALFDLMGYAKWTALALKKYNLVDTLKNMVGLTGPLSRCSIKLGQESVLDAALRE